MISKKGIYIFLIVILTLGALKAKNDINLEINQIYEHTPKVNELTQRFLCKGNPIEEQYIFVWSLNTKVRLPFDSESKYATSSNLNISQEPILQIEITSDEPKQYSVLIINSINDKIVLQEGKIFIFPFAQLNYLFSVYSENNQDAAPALIDIICDIKDTSTLQLKSKLTYKDKDTPVDNSGSNNQFTFTNEKIDGKDLDYFQLVQESQDIVLGHLVYITFRKIDSYETKASLVEEEKTYFFLNSFSPMVFYSKPSDKSYYEYNLSSEIITNFYSDVNLVIDPSRGKIPDVKQFTLFNEEKYNIYILNTENKINDQYFSMKFPYTLINDEKKIMFTDSGMQVQTKVDNQTFLIVLELKAQSSYWNIYVENNAAQISIHDTSTDTSTGKKLELTNGLYSEKITNLALKNQYLKISSSAIVSVFISKTKNAIYNGLAKLIQPIRLNLVEEAANILYIHEKETSPGAILENFSSMITNFSFASYTNQSIIDIFTKNVDLEFSKITGPVKTLSESILIKVEKNLGFNFYLQPDFELKSDRLVNFLNFKGQINALTFEANTLIKPIISEDILTLVTEDNKETECKYDSPCIILDKTSNASLKSKNAESYTTVIVPKITEITNFGMAEEGKENQKFDTNETISIPIRKEASLKNLKAILIGAKYSLGLSRLVNEKYIILPEPPKQNFSFDEEKKELNFDGSEINEDNLYLLILNSKITSTIQVSHFQTFTLPDKIKLIKFSNLAHFALPTKTDTNSYTSLVFISDSNNFKVNVNKEEEPTNNYQKYRKSDEITEISIVAKGQIEIYASSTIFHITQEKDKFEIGKTAYKIDKDNKYNVKWTKPSEISTKYFLFYAKDNNPSLFSAISEVLIDQVDEKYFIKEIDDLETFKAEPPQEDMNGYLVLSQESSTQRLSLSEKGKMIFALTTHIESGVYYKLPAERILINSANIDILIGLVKDLFGDDNVTGITTDDTLEVAKVNVDDSFASVIFEENRYHIIKLESEAQYIVKFNIKDKDVANKLYFYVNSSDQFSLTAKRNAESSFYLGKGYESAFLTINNEAANSSNIDIYTEIKISELKQNDDSSIIPELGIAEKKSFNYSFDVDASADGKFNPTVFSIKIAANNEVASLFLVKIYIKDAIIRFNETTKNSFPLYQYPERIDGNTDNLYIELSSDIFKDKAYYFTNFNFENPSSIRHDSNIPSKISDFTFQSDNSLYFSSNYISKLSQNSKFLIKARAKPESIREKSLEFTQQISEKLEENKLTGVDSFRLKIISLVENKSSLTFVSTGSIASVGVNFTNNFIFDEKQIAEADQHLISKKTSTFSLSLYEKFDVNQHTITVLLADKDSKFYITTKKVFFETSFAGSFDFSSESIQYFLIQKSNDNPAYIQVLGKDNEVEAKVLLLSDIVINPTSEDNYTKIELNKTISQEFTNEKKYAVLQIKSKAPIVNFTFSNAYNEVGIKRSSFYKLNSKQKQKINFIGQLTFVKDIGSLTYTKAGEEKSFNFENDPIITSEEGKLQEIEISNNADTDASFFLKLADKVDFSIVNVSDPKVKTILKPKYNIINFQSKDKLLKKLIVQGNDTFRSKLSFSVLDKVYSIEDLLYIQSINNKTVSQKETYTINFQSNSVASGLLIYSDNENDIEISSYEINDAATNALTEYNIYSDLSLELNLVPQKETNANLILSFYETEKVCIVNNNKIEQEYTKLIFNAETRKLKVTCSKEVKFSAAALFSDTNYTDDELNPVSTFVEKIEFSSDKAAIKLTLTKGFLSTFSKDVTYTLLFQDSKASVNDPQKIFKLKDYLASDIDTVKRQKLDIKDNILNHEITLLDYERFFDYALFAEDSNSKLVMVYDSKRASLKAKVDKKNDEETPKTGLAWYFILLIVLGSLIFVGLAYFIVRKYFFRPINSEEVDERLV